MPFHFQGIPLSNFRDFSFRFRGFLLYARQASLKVAAYARVSTDQDAQMSSFEAQKDYYEKLIEAHPGWALVGIYAEM